MSRLSVMIDRLVLNGFEPEQRQALVEALQGELSRALSEPATIAALMNSQRIPTMRLDPMPLDAGRSGSRKLGAGIARAIGKSLKR
jgi:hypothetical protein